MYYVPRFIRLERRVKGIRSFLSIYVDLQTRKKPTSPRFEASLENYAYDYIQEMYPGWFMIGYAEKERDLE